MADPDLTDLAQLTGLDPEQAALATLLIAPDAGLVAKVSDALRNVLGLLGRANRRVIQLEQQLADMRRYRDAAAERLLRLGELHREEGNEGERWSAGTGRCVGCKRKWPCRSRKILDSPRKAED